MPIWIKRDGSNDYWMTIKLFFWRYVMRKWK